MTNDGRGLEKFVSDVENVLVGSSLRLTKNRRIYSNDGIQLAELDLEIEGIINGRPFRALLECRDRPSQGKAPASWIQQMAARRLQFEFNKVIAISTTGFSDAAVEAAKMMSVELRQISTISPPPTLNWFMPSAPGSSVEISCQVIHASIGLL